MPVRLIVFLLLIFLIISFVGFNFNNASDIRIWFGENAIFEDVPIFISFSFMYVLGIFSAIPFYWAWSMKKRKKKKKKNIEADLSSKPLENKDLDTHTLDLQED